MGYEYSPAEQADHILRLSFGVKFPQSPGNASLAYATLVPFKGHAKTPVLPAHLVHLIFKLVGFVG